MMLHDEYHAGYQDALNHLSEWITYNVNVEDDYSFWTVTEIKEEIYRMIEKNNG